MNTATKKQSGSAIINNAENVVAGRPPILCKPGCQPCTRVSWMFLLTTPGVVPKEYEDELKKAAYHWSPPLYDSQFRNMKRDGTVPVVRLPRKGYVYMVFPQRQRADVWEVSPDGLTRKVLHQVNAEQYATMQAAFLTEAEPKRCSRGGANVPATLLHVEHAADVKELWVGFSPHLLLPAVFKRFLTNAMGTRPKPDGTLEQKPVRELHGRTLNPSLIVGGELAPGTMPLNELSLNAIAEFTPKPSAKFKEAFELSQRPLGEDRAGLATEFAANVRHMERSNSPKANPTMYENTTAIVMVDDDIGVMADHNALRLAAVDAKKLWSIGAQGVTDKPDPSRIWALRSSAHVDMALQFEAARDAHRIRTAVDKKLHSQLAPVTEEDFKVNLANGIYPAGTTWEPIMVAESTRVGLIPDPKRDARTKEMWVASRLKPGTQTRVGRRRLPPNVVEQSAKKAGADTAKGMEGRLLGRVEMEALQEFRKSFEAESARWDERIKALDRDYAAWLSGSRFRSAYFNLVDHDINLTKPDLKLGSLDQQMADFANRLIVIEQAVGGGAVSIHSAKELAKLYKLNPEDPFNYFTNPFYRPFDFKKEVWDDPGNSSEAGESIVGVKMLVGNVRQALDKQEKRVQLESALTSILASRTQMVNLVAASVDKKVAESLGLAQVAVEAAQKAYRVHVKVSLLAEELVHTRPAARARMQYIFNMRVPAGMVLDGVRDAMVHGVMPASFEPRRETSKSRRRITHQQFRNLDGRITTETNFPVLLNKEMLAKLQKEAVASGEGLVELLPDAHLGMSSGPIKVPKSVARRLVQEQSVSMKGALAKTGEGRIIGGIAYLQGAALFDTWSKIWSETGIKQADAVISTASTFLALIETYSTLKLHTYTLRADGARTLTVSTAKAMSGWRLGAGLFGAAASGMDAALAFVRANDASRQGDSRTASAFQNAGALYFSSSVMTVAGASLTYSSFSGVGFVAGRLGVQATAMLGSWFMGVGIVLAIGGFGFMLWALYTAYQDLDTFLDRSYWGKGQLKLGPFGNVTRQQLVGILNDRKLVREAKMKTLGQLVKLGLEDEISACNALKAGLHIGFEWHKNWFSADALTVTVGAGEWPAQRRITFTMELLPSKSSPASPVFNEANQLLDGERSSENNLLEWSRTWAFTGDLHQQNAWARLSYTIAGDNPGDVLTRGQMLAARDTD